MDALTPHMLLQECPRIIVVAKESWAGAKHKQVAMIEVTCPYCRSRLTTWCEGRLRVTPVGIITELMYPAACPSCDHALLVYEEPSPILAARGKVT